MNTNPMETKNDNRANEMTPVKLVDEMARRGLHKHIRLSIDGDRLWLGWDKDHVSDAWLVMLDQCILRIDFLLVGKKWPWTNLCFPKELNHSPFLKMESWNKMVMTKIDAGKVYNLPARP